VLASQRRVGLDPPVGSKKRPLWCAGFLPAHGAAISETACVLVG
jgi:hypothetical protein